VLFVNVTVLFCEDPGANVWIRAAVETADAGASFTSCRPYWGGHDVGLNQLVGGVRREGAGGRSSRLR